MVQPIQHVIQGFDPHSGIDMRNSGIIANDDPVGGLIGWVATVEMNRVPLEIAGGRLDDNSCHALGTEIQTEKAIFGHGRFLQFFSKISKV